MADGDEGGVILSLKLGALFTVAFNADGATGSTFVDVRASEVDLMSLGCGDSSIFCLFLGEHAGQQQDFLQR